jgi:hypothetical protein
MKQYSIGEWGLMEFKKLKVAEGSRGSSVIALEEQATHSRPVPVSSLILSRQNRLALLGIAHVKNQKQNLSN